MPSRFTGSVRDAAAFDESALKKDGVMHPAIWIGAALVGLVSLALWIGFRRRGRGPDLGSVSGSWIAQHRAN